MGRDGSMFDAVSTQLAALAARAGSRVVNVLSGWQQPPQPDVGYGRHGASGSKRSLLGWMTRPGNADEDVVKHLDGPRGLRARSRDLWMGTPLARGGLSVLNTNTIGAGLRLSPQVDADVLGLTEDQADEWERTVEREFYLWASSPDCDAARRLSFGAQQALAFLSALMSGDVFALLPAIPRPGAPYDLRVQLVEADRVCDPWPLPADADVVGGVEGGPHGEPLAYYVAREHPWAEPRKALQNTWTRVPAFGALTGRRQVLHVMPHERPEQRRGVPLLAPVMEALKQLGRYTQTELDTAVITATLTVFVTTPTPESGALGPLAEGEDGTGTDGEPVGAAQSPADPTGQSIELGSGNVLELPAGQTVQTVNPNRPNTAFDGFVRSLCVQLGAAIDVPYEVLLRHFTSSYTASRAALLEFWKTVATRRVWFAEQFCQPVYEEWLSEAVARGRIAAPGFFAAPELRAAWSGAEWNGPSQGQINERVEVAAAHDRVRYGFSTMERETAQLTGRNWHRVNAARARELVKQREAGTAAPYESARRQAGAAQEA